MSTSDSVEQINPELEKDDNNATDQNIEKQSEIADALESQDLTTEIAALEEQLKLEKARAANAIYEATKTKERLEREAETAKKFALEKFAKSLLDVVDNLERALQAAPNQDDPMVEGVQLTLKSMLTTLEKFNISVVDTQAGFNADWHQAVGIDPEAKPGQIGQVLQQGYLLAGRLLRPAMVMVGE